MSMLLLLKLLFPHQQTLPTGPRREDRAVRRAKNQSLQVHPRLLHLCQRVRTIAEGLKM